MQVGEEFEDLRLHRHVEGRRRLVGDQHVRIVGERHGDHHPLALAAGQLVRIGIDARARVGNAHELQKLDRALRAPRALRMPPCAVSGSAIWSPIR